MDDRLLLAIASASSALMVFNHAFDDLMHAIAVEDLDASSS